MRRGAITWPSAVGCAHVATDHHLLRALGWIRRAAAADSPSLHLPSLLYLKFWGARSCTPKTRVIALLLRLGRPSGSSRQPNFRASLLNGLVSTTARPRDSLYVRCSRTRLKWAEDRQQTSEPFRPASEHPDCCCTKIH